MKLGSKLASALLAPAGIIAVVLFTALVLSGFQVEQFFELDALLWGFSSGLVLGCGLLIAVQFFQNTASANQKAFTPLSGLELGLVAVLILLEVILLVWRLNFQLQQNSNLEQVTSDSSRLLLWQLISIVSLMSYGLLKVVAFSDAFWKLRFGVVLFLSLPLLNSLLQHYPQTSTSQLAILAIFILLSALSGYSLLRTFFEALEILIPKFVPKDWYRKLKFSSVSLKKSSIIIGGALVLAVLVSSTLLWFYESQTKGFRESSAAKILTGYDLPTQSNWFDLVQWRLNPLWLAVIAFSILLILQHWRAFSKLEKVSTVLALTLTVLVTQGFINLQADFLFDRFIVQQLLLAFGIPLLITPVVKKIFSFEVSYRPRLQIVLSGGLLLVFSTLVFYSALLQPLLTNSMIRTFWQLLLVALGAWFFTALFSAKRISKVERISYLLATLGGSAAFWVWFRLQGGLLAPHWFGAMGWPQQLEVYQLQNFGVELAIVITLISLTLAAVGLLFSKTATKSNSEAAPRAEANDNSTALQKEAEAEQQTSADENYAAELEKLKW